MRQALGILAGVLSGLVFTASSIAQKRAINAIGTDAPLFRNLVKSPLWLAGFIASFAIGAPLNMAAYVAIGPTLPPALSAMSLAAVPVLARIFLGDRPPARSYAGAAAIALAVAFIGLSGLAIAPENVDWLDQAFLMRACISIACMAVFAVLCTGLGLRSQSPGGNAFALAAGTTQAATNTFMAPIAGQLGMLVSGSLGASGWVIAGAASIALAAVNFGAIALAQLALRKGVAATVIPIQQLPIQAIPIILHVWLYRGKLGEAPELALLASGLVLLLAGSSALGFSKKTAGGRTPVATACLVMLAAMALPSRLGADEAVAKTIIYRYACLDAAGRKTDSIEMRATMRLRAEGIVELSGIDGSKERAYLICMELADPISRLFWPYTYNYYYSAADLRLLAYEGLDENKKNSRIVLVGVQ